MRTRLIRVRCVHVALGKHLPGKEDFLKVKMAYAPCIATLLQTPPAGKAPGASHCALVAGFCFSSLGPSLSPGGASSLLQLWCLDPWRSRDLWGRISLEETPLREVPRPSAALAGRGSWHPPVLCGLCLCPTGGPGRCAFPRGSLGSSPGF